MPQPILPGSTPPAPLPPGSPGDRPRRRPVGRLVLRAALPLLVLAALVVGGRAAGDALPRLVGAVRDLGAWAPAAFVAGYALAVVLGVPASLLTLAAGATFGLVTGTLVVLAGATLGAAGAFLVARHLARDLVRRRVLAHPRSQALFAAVDHAIAADGLRTVLLLRLSPVLPFSLLNYALGLTRVRFAAYLAASVGMIPGTVLYVYSGRVAGDVAAAAAGAPARGAADYALLALGLAATALVAVQLGRAARAALARAGAGAAGIPLAEGARDRTATDAGAP